MPSPTLALSSLLWLAGPSPATATPPSDSPYSGVDQPRFVNQSDYGPHRPLDNAKWWTGFNDPELDGLIDTAVRDSYDVAAAASRIDEAEAAAIQNLAPLMPTASWDTTFETGPLDSLGFAFGANRGTDPNAPAPPNLYYRASSAVNAGIVLDLTGRNVLSYKAAKLQVRAAEDDLAAQRLVLSSQIARTYYDLVAARAQLEVIEKQVQANAQLLELTELRFEAGQASAVDVLQQKQQTLGTQALVPQAQTQVRLFEQQLAILLGTPPGRSFATPDELPPLPPSPGIGSPSDLQESRPDLRAARRRLEAAAKGTKSARRAFAPTLSLNASAGVQAIRVFDWNSQGFWTAGVTLSVPLSTGGLTYGRLKQAKAQERTATHQLSSSTLQAMREVEDAMVRERLQRDALELAQQQAETAEQAFEESRARYAAGLSEYLPVLTALASAQQAQIDVINAHRDLIAARIDLHTALGDE